MILDKFPSITSGEVGTGHNARLFRPFMMDPNIRASHSCLIPRSTGDLSALLVWPASQTTEFDAYSSSNLESVSNIAEIVGFRAARMVSVI